MESTQNEYVGELVNNVDRIKRISDSYRVLNGGVTKLHRSHVQHLNHLIQYIQYENVIYKPTTELMEILGITDHGNFIRFFQIHDAFFELISSQNGPDVERGFYKILVNPEYGYRVSTRKTKEKMLQEFRFYKELSECSKKDITLSPFYQSVKDI